MVSALALQATRICDKAFCKAKSIETESRTAVARGDELGGAGLIKGGRRLRFAVRRELWRCALVTGAQ